MEPGKPEAGEDPTRRRLAERLIGALQKAVRIVGYFSSGHQAAMAALDELVEVATAATAEQGEIAFRLAGDGLYLGDARISHYSGTEDPHLFRLFHNGVRQLSFRAGIGREDIIAFLESVTADMSQPEFAEEDVITTLWARGITGITWVVVETFTEVGEDEEQGSGAAASDELSTFLGEAARARLASDLGEGVDGAGANALALTSADVRFFAAESVASLLEALPKAREGLGSVYGIDSTECQALHEQIARADPLLATRYLDALIAATVGGIAEDDATSTAQSIASALVALARQSGLGAIGEVQTRLVEWLGRAGPDDRLAKAVLEIVLGGTLLTATISSIDDCSDSDLPVALRLLASAPGNEVPRIARALAAAKSPERRRAGFEVLLGRPDGPNILAPLVFELAQEVALDLLDSAAASKGAPAGAVAIGSSAVTHDSAAVRARAVQHLGGAGEAAALEPLSRALFDVDPSVRLHALRGLAGTKKSAGPLKDALQSPRFADLPLSEKRSVALLFAHIEGMRAAPLFHMLLGRKAIVGQSQNDEIRSVVAAGLGYIPDPRAQPALEKLAKTRFVTVLLRNEARKVATALAAGQPAYRESDLQALLAPPRDEAPNGKAPKQATSAATGPLKLATGAYAVATPPMGAPAVSAPTASPPSPQGAAPAATGSPSRAPQPARASTAPTASPAAQSLPPSLAPPASPAAQSLPGSLAPSASAAAESSPAALAPSAPALSAAPHPVPASLSSPATAPPPASRTARPAALASDVARMLEAYVFDDEGGGREEAPAEAPSTLGAYVFEDDRGSGFKVPAPQPAVPDPGHVFEDDRGSGFEVPAPPRPAVPDPAPLAEADPATTASDEPAPDLEALLRDYLEDSE